MGVSGKRARVEMLENVATPASHRTVQGLTLQIVGVVVLFCTAFSSASDQIDHQHYQPILPSPGTALHNPHIQAHS